MSEETPPKPTIEEHIRKIVADELGFDLEDVTPNASFVEDLNADSLDLTELVMRCEEEFDIEIADDDIDGSESFDKLKTVADMVRLVEKAKPAKWSPTDGD